MLAIGHCPTLPPIRVQSHGTVIDAACWLKVYLQLLRAFVEVNGVHAYALLELKLAHTPIVLFTVEGTANIDWQTLPFL